MRGQEEAERGQGVKKRMEIEVGGGKTRQNE